MFLLYVVLCLGTVTTIYPFLLMLGLGFTGPTDQNDNRIIPAFWSDNEKLEAKYIDDKYTGNVSIVDSIKALPPGNAVDIPAYEEFLKELPSSHWSVAYRTAATQVTGQLAKRYQAWLRTKFSTIDDLNKAYIEENVAFQTVQPPMEQLEKSQWAAPRGRKWDDWRIFKSDLPIDFRVPIRLDRMFQDYVKGKVAGQIDILDPAVRGTATKFEDIKWNPELPQAQEFLTANLPPQFKKLGTVESMWAKKSQNPMPILLRDKAYVKANIGGIRSEFNGRNYAYVLDYILLNGRAVANTILFCLLVILTQLIVNPIAAYALSRYPMKATGSILLFLLATMAFPAEVTMIPSFLLLKDLGLLNTFAALVLPGAASGYMIFLLKGFFDSLPQELFESGQIDGAKEITMMWKIAFPLSKPVLGYLALLAFMGAYSAFLYAFLVAQNRSMWTLMVFIYQLQLTAPKAVMMAALTLVALPTLIVFLFCQRVIMKGIVLPGER